MEGYKAFLRSNDDNGLLLSSLKNYSFEIGKTYTETEAILCSQGFHYCDNARDVFKFYPSYAVVCKVTDLADERETSENGDKSCTTKLRIDHVLDGVFDDIYFKNGLLHSPDHDTPALVIDNGTIKQWYKDGLKHRDNDLPAIEYLNGHKSWYVNGVLHRDNALPAIQFANGRKEWFVNGKLQRVENPESQTQEQIQKRNFWRTHVPFFAAFIGIAIVSNL